MADDLYRIGMNPNNPGTSLPGDVDGRGSIGGSDVGANLRDDQRVRDLIEAYMEEYNILNNLNILNNQNVEAVSDCVDGWQRALLPQTIQDLDEGASGSGSAFTETHTLTLPEFDDYNGFLEVILGAHIEFFYDASGTEDQHQTILNAEIYMDDVASGITWDYWRPHTQFDGYTYYFEIPVSLHRIFNPDPTWSPGDHTFKIEWSWQTNGFGGAKQNNSVGMYIAREFFKLQKTCLTDVDPE